MIEANDSQKKQHILINCFLGLILVTVVLVNIKSIFSDFGIDLEYAMITSYRNIVGDKMFLQMREPHQTSSFLCTVLMYLYLQLVSDGTGLVIFLQICGVIIHFAVAVCLYLLLRRKTNTTLAALMCLCFATVRPKDFVFPEFSNMQLWFSTLLFVTLVIYLDNIKKKHWLIIAGICLSLTVLTYPSCVIMLFIVVGILYKYSSARGKDCALLVGTCALYGIVYIGYFAARIGFADFVAGITHIIAGDNTHTEGYGIYMYFRFLLSGGKWFVICCVVTVLITLLFAWICKRRNKNICIKIVFFSVLWGVLFVTDIYKVIVESERFTYIILWVFVMVISLFGWKYCEVQEKKLLTIGMLVSFGCFLSTMLLTNLDLMSIVKYMVLGLVLSFIPLTKLLEHLYPHRIQIFSWWIILLFGFLLIFRKGFIVKTMDGMANNLLNIPVFAEVQEGPAKGIISDYLGAYGADTQVREWRQYVETGDKVLIVGTDTVSNLAYMYGDVEICIPSAISTPTYDESLLEYWRKYPEKRPNVIVIQNNGEALKVLPDSWMEAWLTEELTDYEYAQGQYWRYYRRKE